MLGVRCGGEDPKSSYVGRSQQLRGYSYFVDKHEYTVYFVHRGMPGFGPYLPYLSLFPSLSLF